MWRYNVRLHTEIMRYKNSVGFAWNCTCRMWRLQVRMFIVYMLCTVGVYAALPRMGSAILMSVPKKDIQMDSRARLRPNFASRLKPADSGKSVWSEVRGARRPDAAVDVSICSLGRWPRSGPLIGASDRPLLVRSRSRPRSSVGRLGKDHRLLWYF